MMRSRLSFLYLAVAFAAFNSAGSCWANTANVWHIPDSSEINNGSVHMRDPWIEISNNPSSPTVITLYQGIQKWTNNGATQVANQTGGTLYYKGASQPSWTGVALQFHADAQSQNNQYWKASFSTATISANDPIQYFIFVATDGSNGDRKSTRLNSSNAKI